MIKLARLPVLDNLRANLNDSQRNLLVGCMHVQNELAVLNRILLFSMNRSLDGELGEFAESMQIWCLLQVLAGKILEAWIFISERLRDGGHGERLVDSLDATYRANLAWLRGYFGDRQLKPNPLKLLRDKAAFHYDGLDLGQASRNLAPGEENVYLAKHPANALYFAGSAMVFRTIFAMIANLDPANRGLDHAARTQAGFNRAAHDAHNANFQINLLLYGLIKPLLETACGGDIAPEEIITIQNTPLTTDVILPPFVEIGAEG